MGQLNLHIGGRWRFARLPTLLGICVRYKDEAEKNPVALRERLAKFGMELAEDKTHIIVFGRFARQNAEWKGERLSTFDFLGFTHFGDKARKGKYKVGWKFSAKIKENQKIGEDKGVVENNFLSSINRVPEKTRDSSWESARQSLQAYEQIVQVVIRFQVAESPIHLNIYPSVHNLLYRDRHTATRGGISN